jgi:hypothetical protein
MDEVEEPISEMRVVWEIEDTGRLLPVENNGGRTGGGEGAVLSEAGGGGGGRRVGIGGGARRLVVGEVGDPPLLIVVFGRRMDGRGVIGEVAVSTIDIF